MSNANVDVLLIEDEVQQAGVFMAYFAQSRYVTFRVTRVGTIREAIDVMQALRFDVIVADLNLPDSYGLETIRAIQAVAPEIPVVVLSGVADEWIAMKAVREGAQDYLVKTERDLPFLVRSVRYAMERHRLLDTLRSLSLLDPMTGLYNRRGFETLGEQRLRLARRNGSNAIVMIADLDNLKRVNDDNGHSIGDEMIMEAAHLFRKTFRESDVVARIGGDEFAVVAQDATMELAERIKERLAEGVSLFNEIENAPFNLSVSVGFAGFEPFSPRSLIELLHEADQAMYDTKACKK